MPLGIPTLITLHTQEMVRGNENKHHIANLFKQLATTHHIEFKKSPTVDDRDARA